MGFAETVLAVVVGVAIFNTLSFALVFGLSLILGPKDD